MFQNASAKHIAKKNNYWHYFPYGTIMEDISMPIKSGEKENLKIALNAQWRTIIPFCIFSYFLMALNLKLIFLCLPIVPHLKFQKRKALKKHCEYIHYPLSIYFKNYIKIRRFLSSDIDVIVINKFWLYGIFAIGFWFTTYSFYNDFGGFYGVMHSEKKWHFIVNVFTASLLTIFSSLLTFRFFSKEKYVF